MNLDLQNQIFRFIAESRSVDQTTLTLETTLLGDLGTDGDDAYELLLSFSKTFNVDFSTFEFTRHFGNEGITPLQVIPYFYRLIVGLRGKDPHAVAGKKPITIRDLVRSAEEKRWLEPN